MWTGIEKGADEVSSLADMVESAMEKFGFPREKRPFKPHLTIGRVREINHPSVMMKTWKIQMSVMSVSLPLIG